MFGKSKILIALAFIFTLIFASTTAFADYEATAVKEVPAYHDENLTQRTGNERVDAGDRITVHRETDRAYLVTYPTPRGNKTRWVPKDVLNPQPSGDYNSKVQAFLNDGRYRAGTIWDNCYTYAAQFTSYVFGKSNPRDGQWFNSANEIRNGDVVHVNASGGKSQHWIVVLYRNGDRLTTIEGNWTNHTVNYSDSAYTVQNGTLYRNGSPFRAWDCGYHFQ